MQQEFRHNVVWEDIRGFVRRSHSTFKRLSGQNVLVTGASGFLLSYLADTAAVLNEEFLDEPCKFIALVRSLPKPSERIGHLVGRGDFEFIISDVRGQFKIPEQTSYLVHGASPASPKIYLQKPVETMDANVYGLRTMLDYSLNNEMRGLLYISSGSVYGNPPPNRIPTSEDFTGNTSFTSERSCYHEAKRYCETMCYQFHKSYGIQAMCARPFHNYGPGLKLDDGRVMADFMSDYITGRDIRIRSDGRTKITYCYVADTAEAFWKILLSKSGGESFNVGSDGPETTLHELAKKVANLSTPPTNVVLEPNKEQQFQKEAPKRSRADISKIKTMLGWAPSTGLDEGIKRSFEWYRAQDLR